MLFNSFDFAIFFPIVFLLYWFAFKNKVKSQNILIVIASYIFYGWWDYRFLSLIFISTVVDYVVGIHLEREKLLSKRKMLLWISIIVNLGMLGFFKYFHFFLDSFLTTFTFLGVEMKSGSLNIVLPVGISFYTFQTLSYTIDIYRKKMKPTKDFVAFAAFVSFFPQLVAGPIERASHLLPQFFDNRKLQYQEVVDGSFQIVWGLFKKIVIADNAAELVTTIFAKSSASGSVLLMGAFLFAFQIYCDFSGYSDIAIGTAKFFGFRLMTNFRFPYFSRDIAEFWRRWHISLSSWFRDYVYYPLGGNRVNTLQAVRNAFIVFLVSGLWHGANWTFIFWGGLHALYFVPLLLSGKNRKYLHIVAENSIFPSVKEFFSILCTFCLSTFTLIFFRTNSISHGFDYIKGIFQADLFSLPKMISTENTTLIIVLLMIALLLITEWFQRRKEYVFQGICQRSLKVQLAVLAVLVFLLFLFSGTQQDFIYFQF
jgi:alginate O-acetyltransferase complex protein AlgI